MTTTALARELAEELGGARLVELSAGHGTTRSERGARLRARQKLWMYLTFSWLVGGRHTTPVWK